jgi:hydroxymethylpyrimidine/phosphomethylpyrimidine kinase
MVHRIMPAPRAPGSRTLSCALTIGGLDPGGGAGILADARGISRAGAFACAVAAVLTTQSTSGLREAVAVDARRVIAQAARVLRDQRVRAIKLGALGSAANARAVADFLAIHRDVPVVCDPVMLPTRGRARLLDERAVGVLRARLLPRSSIVLANAPEAEVLTRRRVTRLAEARDAARALVDLGARAALVKGGHLGGRDAVDVLAIGGEVRDLRAIRMRLPGLHGGGCVLSSLVAGRLAVDDRDIASDGDAMILDAARWAKRIHHAALSRAADVGGDMRILLP